MSSKRKEAKSRAKVKRDEKPAPPPTPSTTEDEGKSERSLDLGEPSSESKMRILNDEARLQQLVAASRTRKQSFWETVCYEIEAEYSELDIILTKLGLPPYNYRKDKMFPLPSFVSDAEPPPSDFCITRLYLDYYVFPQLLGGIQAMLNYAKTNGVFQCSAGLFNPLDYIVEYLYANNPKYPERKGNMVPLTEIPFAAQWLSKNPRPPYPRWLTMTADEAARIIQSAARMWLAHRKRKEMETKRNSQRIALQPQISPIICEAGDAAGTGPIFAPYYEEIKGENSDTGTSPATTHSQQCLVCSRFRQFVQEQKENVRKVKQT